MALEPASLSEEQANAQLEIKSATGGDAALRRGTVENGFANAVALVAFTTKEGARERAEQVLTSATARKWAAALGVEPLEARKSDGNVTFGGTNGSTVAASTIIVHAATGRRYLTQTLGTVASSTVTLAVKAEIAGEAGDLEAGVAVQFLSAPAGLDTVGVVAAGGLIDGTDEETDESLWERCLAKMRDKSPGGSVADYEGWALSVDGVTRAKCYAAYPNAGYCTVIICNDSGASPIPSGTLVTEVQTLINVLKPAQAVCNVYATAKTDVTVAITRLKAITVEQEAAVELQIEDLFKRRRGFGGAPTGNDWATDGSDTITADDIKSAILAELPIAYFTLTSPVASTTSPALGVLHLAAINWTGP